MMQNASGIAWHKVFGPKVAGATVTNAVVGHFPIAHVNLFATFRLVMTVAAGTSLTVGLRFGFQTADADVAANGLNFALLVSATGAGQSSLRSVVFDRLAAAPEVVGSPPGILPPWVAVLETTVGTGSTYELYATMLSVK
jgi:hypothetical protein